MRRNKSFSNPIRKCGKAIGPVASRVRGSGKRAVAAVHSIERRRWVLLCAQHAAEFRHTFPGCREYLRFNSPVSQKLTKMKPPAWRTRIVKSRRAMRALWRICITSL